MDAVAHLAATSSQPGVNRYYFVVFIRSWRTFMFFIWN